VAYVVLALAGSLGWASMLAFVLFLLIGSMDLVDMRLGESGALWLDTALCLIFFAQHSGMVRRSFRSRLARILPARYDAAVYAIASAVLLLALVALWQGAPRTLVEAPGIVGWILRAVSLACIAGIAWGIAALGAFDAFGLRPILDHLKGTSRPPLPFTVRGPYRWVRHPLYFFFLVMFWAHPDLTADRLLLNGLWTVWMVVGSVLEERDLVAAFGETYRGYRKRVPMLLPWRIRPAPASREPEAGET
jgi:protein-S-isoprenylcysteine O-methyltransferase Ste14